MKINVYIHIAIMGTVNSVLLNLLNRIKDSGLYDNCNKIYLVYNGNKDLIDIDVFGDKYVHVNGNVDASKCEFPTLDLIWQHSQNEDCKVLYIHTKGVSKPGNHYVIDQTNYLSHFNINKWQDRVKELDEYNCTGVNFWGNPDDINEHPSTWGYGKVPLHYSGNFWWSKSSHIKKLPNPFNWLPDDNYFRWRMMAEMWLCQLNGDKYYNAHSSNVDHYVSPYPEEKYINF